MAVLRRLAAGAAVAALGTFGFASAANASVTEGLNQHHMQWYGVEDDGGLVAIDDNNVGPFQVCHNNVPVNAVGGQVPISDIIGVLGVGSDGNTVTQVHNCDQDTTQNNGDEADHWYRADDDGGLVEVSDNNVGPFQVCDNNVPVNAAGVQVPIDDVNGIFGIGSDGNTATLVESCQQTTEQNNGPNPSNPAPSESSPAPSSPAPSESSPAPSSPAPSESSPAPSSPAPSSSNEAPKPTPIETTAPVTG